MIMCGPFGIIFVAPTTWSTKIMSENLETCVEPYLAAFEQTYAAENYTARTIVAYRCLTRKFGAWRKDPNNKPREWICRACNPNRRAARG